MAIPRKFRTVFLSLFSIIIFGMMVGFLTTDKYKSPQYHNKVQLESGWTVLRENESFKPEELSKADIGMTNTGDTITITKTLDNYNVTPATIHFRSILSTVDVYLDAEKIYSFGQDYLKRNEMLPKYQHFVILPDDYPGKELKIEITATEDNAFSGMSPIVVGDMEDIARSMAQNGRLSLVIGVFLVVFGFILLILSPFLLFTQIHDSSICFSGLISILMGIYILCFNDLFWLFSESPAFYTFIEYFSLYMIPASILLFLAAARQISNIIITIILGLINFSFSIFTSILHILNLVHICHFVTWLHIISVTEGIYVIISLVKHELNRHRHPDEFSTKTMSTNMLLLGLFILLGFSLIDIIKFNVLKFFNAGEVNTNINFMTIGTFFFILSLVLNYFFHCIEYISESNTKQQLEGLAYSDPLSGLYNRSKCELTLAELTGDYTIISIDLDYLKYTNDNYGHSAGDKLITGFSKILKTSFPDASLIGRMGGDEFIVILPFINDESLQSDLNTMTDLMSYKSSLETSIRYSASYGYATNKDEQLEDSPNAQNVYLLADTRMYQMKKQHHRSTLGRIYKDLIANTPKEGGTLNE